MEFFGFTLNWGHIDASQPLVHLQRGCPRSPDLKVLSNCARYTLRQGHSVLGGANYWHWPFNLAPWQNRTIFQDDIRGLVTLQPRRKKMPVLAMAINKINDLT